MGMMLITELSKEGERKMREKQEGGGITGSPVCSIYTLAVDGDGVVLHQVHDTLLLSLKQKP